MLESESGIVIEMAKQFMVLLQKLSPSWRLGYYRFYKTEDEYGANASYVDASGVSLIGALRNKEFYDGMSEMGVNLFEALGRLRGVVLIKAKNDFSYDLQFDFDNPDRWKISKMDGASGIPEGETG